MAYVTTQEVFDFLRWSKQIPNYPTSTTLESVDESGTLAGGSKIYLDQKNVIAGSYTLSYGTTPGSTTNLTETTHYTLDKDIGQISITAAGAAVITTNKVYATYKYNDILPDSHVSSIIDRVQAHINRKIERFYGEVTLVTREEQTGRGRYSRIYAPKLNPPYIVRTQLATAITSTASTAMILDSTTGLSAGDYLTINSEIVSITTVTNGTTLVVARGQLGSTAAAHAVDDWVVNVGVEISHSRRSTHPVFHALTYRKEFDVDSDTGAVQLLHINPERKDELHSRLFPLHQYFNRIRLTYKYGTTSVPDDIKQATILLSAYQLILATIGRALPEGINGFSPEGQGLLKEEAENILKKRRKLFAGGF